MMGKSVKKVLTFVLTAVLAISLLSACGSSTTNNSGANNNQVTPTQPAANTEVDGPVLDLEAAKAERMAISVIGIDWGYGPLSGSAMEKHWEDLFNVDLEIEWVNYEDYPNKVNTLIATNNLPDVVQIMKTNSNFYYPAFTQAIDAGNFVDMSKYIFGKGGLKEINSIMSKWDDSMWQQATYNGGIYILPRSKAEIAQQSGVNVRRDLMKKYGFEKEPTTMDELADWLIGLSNAATEGEGQKIYALDWYGDFMSDRVKAFAVAFTGQMDWGIDENGDFQYIQFNPKYIDFLNWMKKLYDAGVLDKEFALGNAEVSKWKGGRSVGFLTAWYNWNQSADRVSNKIFDSSTPDTLEAWCLIPVKGPEGYAISANSYDIDACIAINSSCNEKKIQKIMQVFNGTEEDYPGYDLLMSDGVEGVHYDLLADGTRDTSKYGTARQEGYVGAWNQIFLKVDADQITAKFKRPGAKGASEESIKRAEEIKAAIVSALDETGLAYANTNLHSETYNANWSALVDDVEAYCAKYVMGLVSADEFNAFINSIVTSDTYKSIQKEFKAAYEANNK